MRIYTKIICLLVVLLFGAGASLILYPIGDITFDTVYSVLTTPMDDVAEITFVNIRIPRTLTAILLGVNLSLAGLILQALSRNPIASPGVLGISQSAGLFVALAAIIPEYLPIPLNILAFIGGLIGGGLTFIVAGGLNKRITPERMILAGLATGAITIAVVRFSFTIDDDVAKSVIKWLIGNVKDVRWQEVNNLIIWAFVGIITCLAFSNVLNILAIGTDTAKGLGVNVVFYGGILWTVATFLTAVSVAAVGPILFLGLMIPHLARLIFGHNHKILAIACPLMGATLMVLADALSRYLLKGEYATETPIGVVISFVGGIYFLFLIKRDHSYGK